MTDYIKTLQDEINQYSTLDRHTIDVILNFCFKMIKYENWSNLSRELDTSSGHGYIANRDHETVEYFSNPTYFKDNYFNYKSSYGCQLNFNNIKSKYLLDEWIVNNYGINIKCSLLSVISEYGNALLILNISGAYLYYIANFDCLLLCLGTFHNFLGSNIAIHDDIDYGFYNISPSDLNINSPYDVKLISKVYYYQYDKIIAKLKNGFWLSTYYENDYNLESGSILKYRYNFPTLISCFECRNTSEFLVFQYRVLLNNKLFTKSNADGVWRKGL